MIQLISDCEGPTCLNDNALELAEHFIPDGGELFLRLSRYDDFLAEVESSGWQPGSTLKIIVPFLIAFGATGEKIDRFCRENINLVAEAPFAFGYLRKLGVPIFMVSTSYAPFAQAVGGKLGLVPANVSATEIDFDGWLIEEDDVEKIHSWAEEIKSQPVLETTEGLAGAQKQAKQRLDQILSEMTAASWGSSLEAVTTVGGAAKVRAAQESLQKTGNAASDAVFVGDSITDKPALEWIRKAGGLAIAFNGNKYAVEAAEIACLSQSALPTALILETLLKKGKDAVLALAENWERGRIGTVSKELLQRFDNLKKDGFPKIYRVTKGTAATIAEDSEKFRRTIRGERIGILG